MPRAPSRRVQAAALLLPLVGLFLLLPPFVTLFGGPARVLGVPLIVFYLFAVWAGLCLAAAWLAGRLPLKDTEPAGVPTSDGVVHPANAHPPPP